MRVAIIDLGYVGLPLSIQFARSGATVCGIDVDPSKIEQLEAGRSYIQHIDVSDLPELARAGKFSVSTDISRVAGADAVMICVPTPLHGNRAPDLSYVLDTGRSIARYLRKGALVVLESTTYPGTTDGELRAVLEKGSNMKAGIDFHLAYSPEREDPGNPASTFEKVPKLVGGLTPACLEKAVKLYRGVVRQVVPVSSCRVAEAAKMLENCFRSVNIALVNELKLVYGAMNIDVWEVIGAAQTKPFGFMPFHPGPGLGGHCIPIDPFYLAWKAREFGQHARLIELAGEINTSMPDHVILRLAEALSSHGKRINESRILLSGLAYKPDVDDDRESPTYHLLEKLHQLGANVSYYDPHVPIIGETRSHARWQGTKSIEWDEATVAGFDAVVIVTAHSSVDYRELAAWAKCIVDTRNVMANIRTRQGLVWKA